MTKHKKIPKFKSEQEEAEFWKHHDSADYLDWSEAKEVTFSKLKPSSTSISLRIPEHLIQEIRNIANKNDVPYQSLIKVWLAEKVDDIKHSKDNRTK